MASIIASVIGIFLGIYIVHHEQLGKWIADQLEERREHKERMTRMKIEGVLELERLRQGELRQERGEDE